MYIHLLAIPSFFVPKLLLTYWRRWMFVIHHATGTRLSAIPFQVTRVLCDNFLIARISKHYDRELDILQRTYTNPLSIQKKRHGKAFWDSLYWMVMTLICSYSKKIICIIPRRLCCLLMNSPGIDQSIFSTNIKINLV